jgi:hypothetical protein
MAKVFPSQAFTAFRQKLEPLPVLSFAVVRFLLWVKTSARGRSGISRLSHGFLLDTLCQET